MHHFSEILLILGIAGLTIPLLHRFRVSPVLGYLLCGIAISPKGLSSWVEESAGYSFFVIDPQAIRSFADLGVIFLMFMIGLKLPLKDLWQMRRHVLGLGSCQVLLTGAIIALIARNFGNSLEISILMGACFALSSTAVVMQLLDEKHTDGSPVGKLCFSILLMQDLAVVPILTMLAAISGKIDGNIPFLVLKASALAAVVVVLIYFSGLKILKPLLRYINPHNRPEWLMSFVLLLVIGTATLTEMAGLSAALGAFLAGLILAETEHRESVDSIIAPIKSLLMGIFFLSIGLMIDLSIVVDNAFWLFASVIGIGVLKAAILFVLGLAFRVEKTVAAETALMLGQSGEFVFVILTLALSSGSIPPDDAQFFMLVTALSMLMTPFVAAITPHIVRQISISSRN